MRSNLPITSKETLLTKADAIVSKTDLKGRITYVNPTFCRISGFDEHELIGAPQNIVRHPDMPVETFTDLWQTLRSGLPWTGLVKNRCKNGDFYWVRANITPVIENGRANGYISVRVRAERHEIEAAATAYERIKKQQNSAPHIHHGIPVKPGIGSLLVHWRLDSIVHGARAINVFQFEQPGKPAANIFDLRPPARTAAAGAPAPVRYKSARP